jgi:multicomponent Na+:H+ antiporter subunit E
MTWLTWPFRILGFACWFAWQVVISNLAVLRDNLTPGQDAAPGIAACATRCRGDGELTLLAALITLTPGTLTLGTTREEGERVLFVHGMYAASAEALRTEVQTMETRMLRAVRRAGAEA